MAMRSLLSRNMTGATRCYSDGKGRVLNYHWHNDKKEIERQQKQKAEEKLRQEEAKKKKDEKEKDDTDKKPESTHHHMRNMFKWD